MSSDTAVRSDVDEEPLQPIADALRGLRFGTVTIVVQDGVIVQVERLEKRRLVRSTRPDPAD